MANKKDMYTAYEELYDYMFRFTINLLKFEPPIKKIRSGEAEFQKYSKQHVFNYGYRNAQLGPLFGFPNPHIQLISTKVIQGMANKLDKFVMKEYKSDKYVKAYNNKYYKNRRAYKLKEQRAEAAKDKPTKAEINKVNAKKITDANLEKVEEAIEACKTCNIKPTIAKLQEITGLGKNSVIKYKKIILNK